MTSSTLIGIIIPCAIAVVGLYMMLAKNPPLSKADASIPSLDKKKCGRYQGLGMILFGIFLLLTHQFLALKIYYPLWVVGTIAMWVAMPRIAKQCVKK